MSSAGAHLTFLFSYVCIHASTMPHPHLEFALEPLARVDSVDEGVHTHAATVWQVVCEPILNLRQEGEGGGENERMRDRM